MTNGTLNGTGTVTVTKGVFTGDVNGTLEVAGAAVASVKIPATGANVTFTGVNASLVGLGKLVFNGAAGDLAAFQGRAEGYNTCYAMVPAKDYNLTAGQSLETAGAATLAFPVGTNLNVTLVGTGDFSGSTATGLTLTRDGTAVAQADAAAQKDTNGTWIC